MKFIFCAAIVSLSCLFAGARTAETKSPNWSSLKEHLLKQNWTEVLKKIDLELVSANAEDQGFLLFVQAATHSSKGEWNAAIKSAALLKGKSSRWDDFADLLTAEARFNLGQLKQSRQAIDRISRDRTNQKVLNDSQILLGKIALSEGKFDEAKRVLGKIEKSSRGSASLPNVIWQLGRAEKGIKSQAPFCLRMLRLYRDFPDFEMLASWGPFLDENKFEGQPTLCSFAWTDSLVRTKNLLMAGQVERANREIQLISDRTQGQKTFETDRLKAQYLIHEGDFSQALQLLTPYFEQHKTDTAFLSLVANAANRSGDSATAIGSYLAMAKLAPSSAAGRNALFQAAFASYQFQDYDGATRRFKEFIKRYPGSSLAADAEWHLSWISYLKNDFESAYESLAQLKQKWRRASVAIERAEYWMAMSQLRMKNFETARSLFNTIIERGNPSGYYPLAANQRLKYLSKLAPPPAQEPTPQQPVGRWIASTQKRFPAMVSKFLPILTPPDDSSRWAHQLPLLAEQDSSKEEGEGTGDSIGEETDPSLVESTQVSPEEDTTAHLSSSTNPMTVQRFDRASRLIQTGLYEWAKWELFEIERKTSNKDYLRSLMFEYEKIDNFHRSVQIASNHFAKLRIDGGFDGQKLLWEKAYPKAFIDAVTDSSNKFSVPPEMIWSIMRAESTFRKEAISPVGALGLMQVMPKTGQKVAEMIGEKSFQPIHLLEPPTAIKIGSKYLQRLWRKFEGNRALVAGGYNAGPHRIHLWLSRFGTLDLDEFIEHIPFVETRNYIKRVLTNYQVYMRIYSGQSDSFPELSQPISLKMKDPVPTRETWEDI